MKKFTIQLFALVTILVVFMCASCSKLIEVDPPITTINGDNVFNEDGTAIAAITGIYANMSKARVSEGTGRLTNIFFTTGLAADELELWNKSNTYLAQWYENNISPAENTWSAIYNMIFVANSAIEKLPAANALTASVRTQLLGEAKFIRALCYFYLVNIYGEVPLAISTNYKVNQLLAKSKVSEVYALIVQDLNESKELLNAQFIGADGISSSKERVRPSKWAAIALLSRVYLYTGAYAQAEAQASLVLSNNGLFRLKDLNDVFLSNNEEAIWQLQPVGTNEAANTKEGELMKLFPDVGPSDNFPVYLTERLVHAFNAYDQRKAKWIDSVSIGTDKYYFASKYKIGREVAAIAEYSTVFRLAELYLVRAESKIRQNRIADGIEDLNILRSRATDQTAANTKKLSKLNTNLDLADALLAVERERQFELFTEWGHRWMDLNRTGRIDAVLTGFKPNWQPTDKLFPIPQTEIDMNPNLRGQQNPGY